MGKPPAHFLTINLTGEKISSKNGVMKDLWAETFPTWYEAAWRSECLQHFQFLRQVFSNCGFSASLEIRSHFLTNRSVLLNLYLVIANLKLHLTFDFFCLQQPAWTWIKVLPSQLAALASKAQNLCDVNNCSPHWESIANVLKVMPLTTLS